MSPITKSLIEELEHAPESVQREVLAFLRHLRARGAGNDGSEDAHALLPLAESAWAADWETAEEDQAWRNFVGGDVVVVPFPFTDLQSSKRRPAVVLATFARGDLPICQITSRSASHPTAVAIGTDDFLRGGIDRPSVALPTDSLPFMRRSSCGWPARSGRPSWLSLWSECVP